jgi:hypothetical protein
LSSLNARPLDSFEAGQCCSLAGGSVGVELAERVELLAVAAVGDGADDLIDVRSRDEVVGDAVALAVADVAEIDAGGGSTW